MHKRHVVPKKPIDPEKIHLARHALGAKKDK